MNILIKQLLEWLGIEKMSAEKNQSKVLFVLKRREDYTLDHSYSSEGVSTGLLNSATFVNDMLVRYGVDSKLVVVTDNNDIDREVTSFQPDHVIIEALWVVPDKFAELVALHPNVEWVVRYHSEASFIASEGIAMEWTLAYARNGNVTLATNSPRFKIELESILEAADINRPVAYLPNYYPTQWKDSLILLDCPPVDGYINIGCFGAIRPLKNHLAQAIAALRFAREIGKKLRFHINGNRVELNGASILRNLQDLFDGLSNQGHELVSHDWVGHTDFLDILNGIDIGMQVSLTETFNIVAADFLYCNVPVVASNEVPWLKAGIANPTSSDSMLDQLLNVYRDPYMNIHRNRSGLDNYVAESREHWLKFLK